MLQAGLSGLMGFWLFHVKWFDEMIDVYVNASSSKDVLCKGESLGNHLEGLEIHLKDILMIMQAKQYISISRAWLYAGMFLQTDKTV